LTASFCNVTDAIVLDVQCPNQNSNRTKTMKKPTLFSFPQFWTLGISLLESCLNDSPKAKIENAQ